MGLDLVVCVYIVNFGPFMGSDPAMGAEPHCGIGTRSGSYTYLKIGTHFESITYTCTVLPGWLAGDQTNLPTCIIVTLYWFGVRQLFGAASGQRMVPCKQNNQLTQNSKLKVCCSKYSTYNEDTVYALFTRPLCKSRLFLWSQVLAVNENLVDRKQGVRFGQFLVYGLVKIYWNSQNHTLQTHQTAHPVSYQQNFYSLLETLDNKTYIHVFVISWVFTGTNFLFAGSHSLTGRCSKQAESHTESIQWVSQLYGVITSYMYNLNLWWST